MLNPKQIFQKLITSLTVKKIPIEEKVVPTMTSYPTHAYNTGITGVVTSAAPAPTIINATGAAMAGGINPPIFTTAYGTGALGMGTTFGYNPPASVFALHGTSNQEIVRLERDGSVKWAKEINVDEAAEAFGRAVSIGGEMAAGITAGTKRRMRDAVFEEIINIAKDKGSLSAEDLTYLWEASKIMDKLKGAKE